MSRGMAVKKLLLESSTAAFWAGVEIHNKPHISYRYQTTVILILNAWELLLKAYAYTRIGKQGIYEKNKKGGKKHTKSFTTILESVEKEVSVKNREFKAVCENLRMLDEYRNQYIHFADKKLDPIIFMLISKAVTNYNFYITQWFNLKIAENKDLIILPIGIKLPFHPTQFLKQNYDGKHNEFIDEVNQIARDLHQKGIEESLFFDFSINLSKSPLKNADLVAAIDENNPNAIPVALSDEEFQKSYSLSYADLIKEIKKKDPDIKVNEEFFEAKKEVEKDGKLCYIRYLDPTTKSSTSRKKYYSLKAIDTIIEKIRELKKNMPNR